MPKKMRRLALRGMLSAKTRDRELIIIDRFELNSPQTKEIVQILKALGADSSTLIVTPEPDANVVKSARNLPQIKTLPCPLLNVLDLLSYKFLVITVAAVRCAEQIWGKEVWRAKTGGRDASLRSVAPSYN
jgi:large subunit ribosomal protein L4